MKSMVFLTAIATVLTATIAIAAQPQRDEIVQRYAAEAKASAPGFDGFSAERGRQLYLGPHQGGKPKMEACAACHTRQPTSDGRHVKTGRSIDPMAVSANPERFTDFEKVEKRFGRDCKNVLGRPCTAQEKGDFIEFLSSQ